MEDVVVGMVLEINKIVHFGDQMEIEQNETIYVVYENYLVLVVPNYGSKVVDSKGDDYEVKDPLLVSSQMLAFVVEN